MPFQERNTVAYLFVGGLTMTLVGWRLVYLHQAGRFGGDDALQLWAQTILIAVVLGILATIGATILSNILWSIANREPKPSFVTDERDRQFEIRASRVTSIVAGIGYLIALIVLATGQSALFGFTVIFYAFSVGDFAGNLYRLRLYRAGSG